MIKPNWDIFKAKYSENPQDAFEWFCYMLFCKEFKKENGVFRYINQAGLETEPINYEGKIIGWQAKFFSNNLSDNKATLIDTIQKTKKYYKNLKKLIIYTNKDWGKSRKGNIPKAKGEIENKAKKDNIEIEWRTSSFFESPFVAIENEIIAKHFFLQESSLIDLVEDQKKHTKNILNEINTCFYYNGNEFDIDRSDILTQLKNDDCRISILSGPGGVGKTVIIKKLFEQMGNKIPFYVFKATEFELRHINDLFDKSSANEFAETDKDNKNKIVVIDSAEKLLYLNNSNPFKEFLSIFISSEWKIIFTTRNNYLEDLTYQLSEIYNIMPLNIRINNIDLNNLYLISEEHSFTLPRDEKLLNLIRNPFYLNEYIKFYNDVDGLNYCEFKNTLWSKIIVKSKPARELCFLECAFNRANSGQFLINPHCNSDILDKELFNDGLLGSEKGGYFITHDIYEEWALERIIEREFFSKTNVQEFLINIGNSLPIRRSFRNWISEKLLLEDDYIKEFIEELIFSNNIESFWKDETLISVLLSDYSKYFFDVFRDELLTNQQELLKQISFLLRIACKEVDDSFIKKLGLREFTENELKILFTRPKGNGWKSFVEFISENIDNIGFEDFNSYLSVLYDWNRKIGEGDTTRLSGLIALKYYQWKIEKNKYWHNDYTKEKLFVIIIYSASEIQDELKEILEEIFTNKWKYHRDKYFDLSKYILTDWDGKYLSEYLPEYVIRLADLFWTYTPSEDDTDYHSPLEYKFGIESCNFDYIPASAYQTPIYWLLKFSFKETIDFIISFTNKCVKSYVNSGYDNSIQQVEVMLDSNNTKKQYISHGLWNMYRGTGSPVSPYLLQSIHMALEKFFLEMGKELGSDTLESWLLYLISRSESASITSVVTSIVLAYPEKTFNVAEILFKTREFIEQDTNRLYTDQDAKTLYSIGPNWGIKKSEIFDNERLKTCEDSHRKWSLEGIFLQYQLFRSEKVSEEEAEKRQSVLWKILDNYYNNLPPEPNQNENDKTWRLFLARMDRRKMDISTKDTEEGIRVEFHPQVEPELKEISEKSTSESTELMKYSNLRSWAIYRFSSSDKCKQYNKYEENHKLALEEAMDIFKKGKLKYKSIFDYLEESKTDEDACSLVSQSIPAYVCSVALRDYYEELTKKELSFCKDVLLYYSSLFIQPNYIYQITDGVEPSLSSLPFLLKGFPEEKARIKVLLLLGMFNEYPVGNMESNITFSRFSIIAIHSLWKIYFDEANSLFLGYLLLKTRYEELWNRLRRENYITDRSQLVKTFIEEYGDELHNVIDCKLEFSNIKDINKLNFSILKTAFQTIPFNITCENHKKIAKLIILKFSKTLLSNDEDDKIHYSTKHEFLKEYAHFVLGTNHDDIMEYLNPFLEHFKASESIADLFQEFIYAEDRLNTYDNFWFVWDTFKEKIYELCKDGDRYSYISEIVKTYLFAKATYDDTIKEWRSLKDKNKKFFKEIADKIGHCPSTLYAISKTLNDIGSPFMNDGVLWISNILTNNPDYMNKKLETNTIYYIEKLVRKYTYHNRESLKKHNSLKNKIIIILDFLIEKGSVIGYMLRESII